MTGYLHSIQLGAATVTVINIGDLLYSLADWLVVPEDEQPPDFAQPRAFPTQCVHIALPGASVLVDASSYEVDTDSPHVIPGYQPPPGLLATLDEIGIHPEAIDRVIITHGHQDHFSGITRRRDSGAIACFPGARHYLGRADWEQARAMIEAPGSIESRTLGVLQSAGLLELVEGRRELGDGVTIIPAPGETPGHQIVRIHSEGRTLLCIGDIYHHTLEVEHAAWAPQWADAERLRATRRLLAQAAQDEDALLIATHIAGVGRLRRTEASSVWETL